MPITCVDICKKVFYKKHLFAVFVVDDVKTGFVVELLALVEHTLRPFLPQWWFFNHGCNDYVALEGLLHNGNNNNTRIWEDISVKDKFY